MDRVKVRCHYCDVVLTPSTRTRDHIVPKALGGDVHNWNTVWSCGPCNVAKAATWPTCTCSKCGAARRMWRQKRPVGKRRAERRRQNGGLA